MAMVIMCILSDIDIYMMYMMYVCTAKAISMRDVKWRMDRDVRVRVRDLEDVQLLTNGRLRMSAGSASEIWPGIASLRE